MKINLVKEKIAISVIGTGKMGFYHARLLSRMGYLDSIVDTNTDTAKNVGEQFDTKWFTSLEEMSSKTSPNGVILAVPTKLHHLMAEKVIKNIPGLKVLLIEKPIASSAELATQLKTNLLKTNVKIIVGHVEVYNPVITKIQGLIEQNVLGDLRSVFIQRRGTVGETRLDSIGDVYEDIGVHDFDIVSRILPKGEVNLFSSAVKARGVDNSSTIIITPESKDFYVTLLMSREYAGKLRTIDIEGTKATLRANLLTQMLEIRSLEIARGVREISAIRIPFSNGEEMKVYGEPLLLEMWNLIDCIRGDSIPLVSIDDGINALRLVEAARKSIKKGSIVKLKI